MRYTFHYFRQHLIRERRLIHEAPSEALSSPDSSPDSSEQPTIEALQKKIDALQQSQEQLLKMQQEMMNTIKALSGHMPTVQNGTIHVPATLTARASAADADARTAAEAATAEKYAPHSTPTFNQVLPRHLPPPGETINDLSPEGILAQRKAIKDELISIGSVISKHNRYRRLSRSRNMRGYLKGEPRPPAPTKELLDHRKELTRKDTELKALYIQKTRQQPPSSATRRITYLGTDASGMSEAMASDGSIMRMGAGPSTRDIPHAPRISYGQASLIRNRRSGGELYGRLLDVGRTQAAEGREPRHLFEQRARQHDRFNTHLDTAYARGGMVQRMYGNYAYIDKPVYGGSPTRYRMAHYNGVRNTAGTSSPSYLKFRMENPVLDVKDDAYYAALKEINEADAAAKARATSKPAERSTLPTQSPSVQKENLSPNPEMLFVIGDSTNAITDPVDILSYDDAPPQKIIIHPHGNLNSSLYVTFDSGTGRYTATQEVRDALVRAGVTLFSRRGLREYYPQIALTKPGTWDYIASNRMDRKGYGTVEYIPTEEENQPAAEADTSEEKEYNPQPEIQE